jgi:hypothetical protein
MPRSEADEEQALGAIAPNLGEQFCSLVDVPNGIGQAVSGGT